MKLYKFLKFKNGKIVSDYDSSKWTIGKWRSVKGEVFACNSNGANGFHASAKPLNALSYVNGDVLAIIEGEGETDKQSDKVAFRKMRIVKAYHWTKEDSVALTIYSAGLCLHEFEKVYPNDKRARQAIQAAKIWLKNPTEENRAAADSADYSADYSAARSANSAARSAVRSANSAVRSAARSAVHSARSARSARSAITKKINTWMVRRIKKLVEVITNE